MTRKSVISVMTVKIIELDVCTAPPGTGDCATLWVVLRRAQDEGRSDDVFRLLPSAGVTAFRFDIRCSKHELCKAPALCVFVAIVPRAWWRGGATRMSGCEESRLGQGKCPCRDGILEKKTPTKGVETQRSGHIGRRRRWWRERLEFAGKEMRWLLLPVSVWGGRLGRGSLYSVKVHGRLSFRIVFTCR